MNEHLIKGHLLCIFTALSSIRHIGRLFNKMGFYRRKQKSSVRDVVSAVSVNYPVLSPYVAFVVK